MVFEKVVELLKDFKDIDMDITPDTAFDDLGMDSLDRVELIMSFEEAFGIQIEMNENIRKVQDLVSEIERLTAEKGGASA